MRCAAEIRAGLSRRDRRAKALLKRLAAKPTESIPGICDGWSETVGAYRFSGNSKIDRSDVMAPHWQRTATRMRSCPVVLFIADTTELDFNGQETEGPGPLSYEAQAGMYLHPTYAVTTDREPFGVIAAWMWAREAPAIRLSHRWAWRMLNGLPWTDRIQST